MADKAFNRFVKASNKAANEQVQHVAVVLSPDGNLQMHGSDNFVRYLSNSEIKDNLLNTLRESVTQEGVAAGLLLTYPKLPCLPYSQAWKGSAMIRGVLTKMLASIGYGGGGTRKVLGVGPSPPGWPEHIIPWADYKGATKSHLSSGQVTEIIVTLLQAAQIDPATHVREHLVPVEGEPDENDNNRVEIEELLVDVQEEVPFMEENDNDDNENNLGEREDVMNIAE